MANFFFNPKESVKVGSSEIFLIPIHVGRFQIFLFCEAFGLKFGTCVINIKMMLC